MRFTILVYVALFFIRVQLAAQPLSVIHKGWVFL